MRLSSALYNAFLFPNTVLYSLKVGFKLYHKTFFIHFFFKKNADRPRRTWKRTKRVFLDWKFWLKFRFRGHGHELEKTDKDLDNCRHGYELFENCGHWRAHLLSDFCFRGPDRLVVSLKFPSDRNSNQVGNSRIPLFGILQIACGNKRRKL